jgi:hypothetical protein
VWDEHFRIDAVVLASGELAAHATKVVATSPNNEAGGNSSSEAAAVAEVNCVSTNVPWGLFSATGPAGVIPQLPGCSGPAAAPPTPVYQGLAQVSAARARQSHLGRANCSPLLQRIFASILSPCRVLGRTSKATSARCKDARVSHHGRASTPSHGDHRRTGLHSTSAQPRRVLDKT